MKITKWDEYISGLGGKTPARGMSAFHARFKLATSIQGIEAPGVAANSLDTYSALCKLGLSYSTLDHLESLLGIDDHPVINANDLAHRVRTTWPAGLEIITKKMNVQGMLLSKLETLFKDHSQGNVRPLAEALRHSIFHGSFTPTGWKLQSKESLLWIDGLSQVALRKADQTFSNWLKSQNPKF